MASIKEDKPVENYTVVVDDNYHYQNPEHRYEIPGFASLEEAIEKCKSIVDTSLAEGAKPGNSAERIYGYYQDFGDDPWIAREGASFSAWEYAKANAHRFVQ